MVEAATDITRLLIDWNNGDQSALEQLTPLVYRELRLLARRYLRAEHSEHALQPTELVHESYLRLVEQARPDFKNRAHFFGVAARIMRQVLVDHARQRRALKRDGGRRTELRDTLFGGSDGGPTRNIDVLDLDEALQALHMIDPRKTRVVELRFFGGLSVEETAEALQVSVATVHRDAQVAEAWLYRRLSGARSPAL
jgi:RNA polymerase sigma factor (TIGR02999 family)